MQTGISRVKAMGSNDRRYNTQSLLLEGAGKNSNSTGWSTNSYSLPDLQLNTPTQHQQYKGLPDFTVPPPVVQPSPVVQLPSVVQPPPQQNGLQTGSQRQEENLMRVIDAMEQQMRLNSTKSGLVVQNFLATLDTNISDSELVEKILQMFSDIPTKTQAIAKLKALQQGENESILAYNQRYRILVERLEGRPIEQITSPVAMEMYLGTIIPLIRKSIKNSLFWNSKHAPRTVGEAMSKAQQLYVKHLYATGDQQEDDHGKMGEEVVINEISQKFENRYRDRRSNFRDLSQNRRDNYSQEARTNEMRWQPYNNSLNSRQTRYQEMNGNRYAGEQTNSDAGLWIQMIESTLRLVDRIDKKESKTQL